MRQAFALEQAGDLAGAEAILHDVLSIQPGEVSAVLALERIARRRGTLESALPWFERAVRAAPRHTILRQIQLRVLAELGRAEEVRAVGGAWVGAGPRDATPYREFASALSRVGERDSALAVLLRGRETLGGVPALAVELGDLYVALRSWDHAVAEWLRLVRQGAPSRRVVLEKVAVHSEGAQPAIRMLADSLARPRAPSEYRAAGAVVALYAGDEALARRLAAELLPGSGPAERRELAEGLARAARRLDRPDITAWSYTLLLEGASSAAEWGAAALRVAGFDLERGDTAAAIDLVSRTLERTPPGSAVHRSASALVVEVKAGAGATAEARQLLEAHARRYPNDATLPQLAASVASSYLRAGEDDDDVEAASAMLDQFVPADLSDRSAVAAVDAVRARIALYRGDWEAASRHLQFAAAALTGAARTEAIELASLLESANAGERRALAAALREIEAGRAAEGAAEVAGLPAAGSAARAGLLLWAVRRGAEPPLADSLLRTLLRDHPDSPEAPAALLRLAELALSGAAREGAAGAARAAQARALLERLILEYPRSALVPLARRRLDELQTRVPSS